MCIIMPKTTPPIRPPRIEAPVLVDIASPFRSSSLAPCIERPLSDSPQTLGIAQADTSSIHLHQALIAPGLKNGVDRLAGESHELSQVALTEQQRNQHAPVIANAVLTSELEQGVREACRCALSQEFLDSCSQRPKPQAD